MLPLEEVVNCRSLQEIWWGCTFMSALVLIDNFYNSEQVHLCRIEYMPVKKKHYLPGSRIDKSRAL